MDETLRQIGELLLGSIPTIIFFVLLFGLYVGIVHKPLAKVLAERHSRTQGAIEKARNDIATAEARTAASRSFCRVLEFDKHSVRNPEDLCAEAGGRCECPDAIAQAESRPSSQSLNREFATGDLQWSRLRL